MKITYRQNLVLSSLYLVIITCSPVEVETDDLKLYHKARKEYQNENFSQAADLFEELISEHTYSSKVDNATYYCGRSYYKKGNHYIGYSDTANATKALKSASQKFHKIDKKSSYLVDAKYYIVKTEGLISELSNTYKPQELISKYTEIITNYPENRRCYYSCMEIGFIYRKTGNLELAAGFFDNAQRGSNIDLVDMNSLYWGGLSYHSINRNNEAQRLLYEYVERFPNGGNYQEADSILTIIGG